MSSGITYPYFCDKKKKKTLKKFKSTNLNYRLCNFIDTAYILPAI